MKGGANPGLMLAEQAEEQARSNLPWPLYQLFQVSTWFEFLL